MTRPAEARVGTAGSYSPGTVYTKFFNSIVNVWVRLIKTNKIKNKKGVWHYCLLESLSVRSCRLGKTEMTSIQHRIFFTQLILLFLQLRRFFFQSYKYYSRRENYYVKLTGTGKTQGNESPVCDSKAQLPTPHLTNVELAVQFQSCVPFCWGFPDLQGQLVYLQTGLFDISLSIDPMPLVIIQLVGRPDDDFHRPVSNIK